MRHENGYGTVSLIDRKSKRRKPYRVQYHIGWTDDGKPIRKTIGYAHSRTEGRQMLAEYHDKPYDLDMNNVTFGWLYEKWYEYKKTTGIAEISLRKYKFIKKHYSPVENKPFINITRADLQSIIDNTDVSAGFQDRIRNLYHQMYEYKNHNHYLCFLSSLKLKNEKYLL